MFFTKKKRARLQVELGNSLNDWLRKELKKQESNIEFRVKNKIQWELNDHHYDQIEARVQKLVAEYFANPPRESVKAIVQRINEIQLDS